MSHLQDILYKFKFLNEIKVVFLSANLSLFTLEIATALFSLMEMLLTYPIQSPIFIISVTKSELNSSFLIIVAMENQEKLR